MCDYGKHRQYVELICNGWEKKVCDLVRREDAIEVIYRALRTPVPDYRKDPFHDSMSLAISMGREIQSAQPERKKGKWIEPSNNGVWRYDQKAYAECSVCGKKQFLGYRMNYCPNCGAYMRGENDEAD